MIGRDPHLGLPRSEPAGGIEASTQIEQLLWASDPASSTCLDPHPHRATQGFQQQRSAAAWSAPFVP